jgi:MFS family permease
LTGEAATRRGDKSPHPNWTLAACILASSLSFVEGSVLNVALPAIRGSFGAGVSDVQWVVNAYLLPLSALLLLGGALGDQHGRKRLLILGTGLFAAASLLCAGAESRLAAGRTRAAGHRRRAAAAQQPCATERDV